ncbi:hypothetical protein [Thauera sp.]|uniref:hypothetical protein n=1 Tax=Thauera sp. TaxID=1905334 RepID=UPI0039E4D5AB
MAQYVIQKEELAQAALKLREVLHVAREDFLNRGFSGSAECVDYALKKLNPILDLCISKELNEPFDFIGYMGRIMGDHLDFPNIRPFWWNLCTLGRGGLTPEEFWNTDFVNLQLIPEQLRPSPEYQPSKAMQENIKREQKFKER